MGDFNAHSPLWGCQSLDAKGKIIEDFLSNNNLCFLNNKNMFTYLHPATGSKTSIDLTICDPSFVVDLDWTVHDDLCGCDHFPLIVKCSKPRGIQAVQRWKLTKADWDSFSVLCEQRLTAERFGTAINEAETFTTSLHIGGAFYKTVRNCFEYQKGDPPNSPTITTNRITIKVGIFTQV